MRCCDRRIPSIGTDDADRIAAALGDLPLAVSQAAALLSDTGLDARAYSVCCSTRTREVLAHQRGRHSPPMAVSWAVAVDRLAADEPEALQLLTLAAWLAPEPIPLLLLAGDSDGLPQQLAADLADPLAVGRLLGIIRRRGMAQVQPGSLTPAPGAGRPVAGRTGGRTDRGWPATVARTAGGERCPTSRSTTQPPGRPGRPGWRMCWRPSSPDRAGAAAVGDVTRLLRRAGEYLLSRGGDPRAALPLFERAHQLNSAQLAADDPQTQHTAAFLASVLNTLGEHDRAGDLNRETLANLRRPSGRTTRRPSGPPPTTPSTCVRCTAATRPASSTRTPSPGRTEHSGGMTR